MANFRLFKKTGKFDFLLHFITKTDNFNRLSIIERDNFNFAK